MSIIRKIIYFIVMFSSAAYAQQKQICFLDIISNKAIDDIILREKEKFLGTTGAEGKIIIANEVKEIYASHINYKDTLFTAIKDTLFLEPFQNGLKEVVINVSDCDHYKKYSFVINFIDINLHLNPFGNFAHNTQAATFIPADENVGKEIKILKYWPINFSGVKNLKYLPFKALLYTVDTVTGMPKEKMYESEIIKKENRKRWVEKNILQEHIVMHEEGIFIVFEVLGWKDYKQEFVQAKCGTIEAVPTLRAKYHDENNPRKSYYRYKDNVWEFVCHHFMMDIEMDK